MQKGGALSMEEGVVGSALNDVSQVETSFKKPSAKLSVLPKIFIVFALYLALLISGFLLFSHSDTLFSVAICSALSLVLTVTLCFICLYLFSKADQNTPSGKDTLQNNLTASSNTMASPSSATPASSDTTSQDSDALRPASNIIEGEYAQQIGESCGLTKRELEVFIALLQGENAGAIESNLGISRYTVKTHIGSVYRKTNVHSQQELIEWFTQECHHAE